MDPLSFLFYVLMAMLGLVVLYFVARFVYMIAINVLKASVLFYPVLIAFPIAIYLWIKGYAYIGVPLLILAFIVSLIWYPKKTKIELKEIKKTALNWPDTFRGRLLSRIDKTIAR